jgi:hypothetical protein
MADEKSSVNADRLRELCRELVKVDPHDHEYDQCIFCGGGKGILRRKDAPRHTADCPWQEMQQLLDRPSDQRPLKAACKCVEVDAGGCVGFDVKNCPLHNPESPFYEGGREPR